MESDFDPTPLQQLKEDLGGDTQAVQDLIGSFLLEAPQLVDSMRAALGTGDAAAFRRAAHTLKSNAASFGGPRISALARHLEESARLGRLPERHVVDQMEAHVADLRKRLQAWRG